MRNVVGIYMSTSSYAIDSAWFHLGQDDKIEKFIPLAALAVPAAFGALGAYTGAGGRFTDDEGNLDLNFGGNAVLQDPLTGGLIAEKELESSFGDRLLGGAVGATQAINPFAYAGAAGRGIKGLRAGRQSNLLSNASKAGDDAARAAAQAGGSAAEIKQARILAEEAVLYPGVRNVQVAPGVVDSSMSLGGMGRRAAGGAVDATGRGLRGLGASRLARLGGRAAQLAGQFEHHLGGLPPFFPPDGEDPPDTSGFEDYTGGAGSGQSGAGAFGAGGGAASGFGQDYGVGDLSSQFSNLTERKEIFNPTGSAFEQQAEFGGFGKGDNMKIGEQILKEVTERMNDEHLAKAKCPKCGKDCIDKMHCMAKADKKPAHGMVIVIGSKAGPGPSKNGKRQKLDSEKDKKKE